MYQKYDSEDHLSDFPYIQEKDLFKNDHQSHIQIRPK